MDPAAPQLTDSWGDHHSREGDRVRIAIRRRRDCEECPHFEGEDDRTGRIVRGTSLIHAPSHPYLVMFDTPCRIETAFSGDLQIAARHYAADELELLC